MVEGNAGEPWEGHNGLHIRSHANEGNNTKKVGGEFACREQGWPGINRDLKFSRVRAREAPGKVRADAQLSREGVLNLPNAAALMLWGPLPIQLFSLILHN